MQFKYDITNPVGVIFCSEEIAKYIEQEPLYVPKENVPQELLAVADDSKFGVKLIGFLLDKRTANVASVAIDLSPIRIKSMLVAPFPPEVLSQVIPWTLHNPIWKTKVAWGNLFPLDNTINALFLGELRNDNIQILSHKRITQPKGTQTPRKAPKNKFRTTKSIRGLIDLIMASK